MTYESETAKQASYQFECKKDGLRQTQENGVKVTFSINPVDMPAALYGDMMGQRYMAVIVPINDDETPKLVSDASKDVLLHQSDLGQGGNKPKSFAGHGKMLAQDPEMNSFLSMEHGSLYSHLQYDVESTVKNLCEISSCSELIEGSAALTRLRELRSNFNAWKMAKEQEQAYTR